MTLKVTEADREAAVDLAHALGISCEDFTSGAADTLVQHLARQRQQALQEAAKPPMNTENWTFQLGDHVRKKKGSLWRGRVVGFYSSSFTTEGYVIESLLENGNVQVYPVAALEPWGDFPTPPESATQ